MKIALTEKEMQLLEIMRSVTDGKICVQVAKGVPENVVVTHETDWEHKCEELD